jgi:hypothetical protein
MTALRTGETPRKFGGRPWRLLADAAQSLGLPRDASPAMIVGALTERPIATPEAFRLLRVARQAVDDEGLL